MMSRSKKSFIGLALLLLGIVGCSAHAAGPVEELVPVSGTVTVDGKPHAGVAVSFIPTGSNIKAHRGSGVTDSEGHFEMLNYRNQEGLPEGAYTVCLNLWLLPDGTAPPADKPLVLSGAVEVIDPAWSSLTAAGTHNTVTVPADGKLDFEFKAARKK